jgi:hypothetical protein
MPTLDEYRAELEAMGRVWRGAPVEEMTREQLLEAHYSLVRQWKEARARADQREVELMDEVFDRARCALAGRS